MTLPKFPAPSFFDWAIWSNPILYLSKLQLADSRCHSEHRLSSTPLCWKGGDSYPGFLELPRHPGVLFGDQSTNHFVTDGLKYGRRRVAMHHLFLQVTQRHFHVQTPRRLHALGQTYALGTGVGFRSHRTRREWVASDPTSKASFANRNALRP